MAKLHLLVAFALLGTLGTQGPTLFARYPHIGGGKIAFCYHGDIWVAREDGSAARKLTHHVADDKFPRFSPDGRWIAFSSNRMGNDDLYLVAVEGGAPRQVTFHSTRDTMLYWMPDGKRLLFASTRGARAFGSPLYTVSVDGDLPVPLDMDQGAAGMVSQDGGRIAFNRYGFRYWRKGYRGNSNTDIWVQDLKSKEITQLTDLDIKGFRKHTQDAYPMWGADGKIYFLSERDGLFNIWRISSIGGAPEQVSFHDDDGVQYPSISADGRTIVYENAFQLWRLPVPDGKPEEIPVALDFDAKANLVTYLRSEGKADSFGPSPEGDYLAVDFHGEVFVVPTDPQVGEKKQVTASGWRDRYPIFSPDGQHLAYISDQSGDEEIWLWTAATGERKRLTGHASLKRRPVWAPDSKTLAYAASNSLFCVDVASGDNRELGHNEEGGYTVDGFSEDGKWLVYTRRDADLDAEVYLFEIATRAEHNVTQNPFRDGSGKLTPDGKTLVFLSSRDGGTNHLFKVSLAAMTEDPDDPLVRERKARAERAEKKQRRGRKDGDGEDGDGEEGDAPADDVEPLRIDLDRIDRRAVQLTRGEDGVTAFAFDAEKLLFLGRDDKGRGLFSIGLDGKDRKRIADGAFSRFTLSGDRKTAFYRDGEAVFRMPLGSKKKEKVSFDFTVTVDQRAEWKQVFEESWRIMKYRFYDPDMHGVDWEAVRERYRPLLAHVGQNQDLYDLTNEMIGELNASHTGVSGPSSVTPPPTYRTALLGMELAPSGGGFRIRHIYRDGPADKEWIDLEVGEFVRAIDGHAIIGADNYWQALNHSLNDYVTLEIAASPTGGETRKVRLRTATSLRNIKYDEWVHGNRKFVEKISAGRIAYLHIRSMSQSSLRKFENEIDEFWNAKGIVIDIRYNGGGNIDQQLLDILERRPYEYWNSRWGGRSWGRRPRQAIAGPKVMLINRRSGSDSEVTPLGFRDLGLGRIVGTPTAGAVIATGSYRLINGGRIRTPGSKVMTYDPTKPNNYGINLENYGVAPDVWVENTPADELSGFDRELKEAVDEALRMLGEKNYQHMRDQ